MHTYKAEPGKCEIIKPADHPPNKGASFHMKIAGTREESKAQDAVDQAEIKVYSDGSGHNGQVGAAVALICGDQPVKILHYHLGPLTHHTTYEAEIIGVLLALQLIGKEWSGSMASVKLDNQAVIQALSSCQAKPGNSLLSLIHLHCDRLTVASRHRPISLCLDWISGHDGIRGNELADAESKKATSMDSSPAMA